MSVRSPLFPFGVLELQARAGSSPSECTARGQGLCVYFPIMQPCAWGCLTDGSTLAQSSAWGRDIGEGLYAARDLREGNPKVPLALFLGSVIGFCTQDPFAYFVICHCLGFSNCTKLNLFIIRK